MTATLSAWVRCYQARPGAMVQLVCLPHAGGGASSYRGWAAHLPASIELLVVQYPGREDRFSDVMVDDMRELVAAATDELAAVIDRPYALFGHSMGSAIAYETAQELSRRRVPGLRRLIVSGRRAPQERSGGDVHRRDDEGLCAELQRLGGTHQDVLADDQLRRAVLRYVRNDYRLIESYRPGQAPPLDCPITVFVGTDDPELTVDGAARWSELSPIGSVSDIEVFPGDHFYLGPQREQVVAAVVRRLAPAPRTGQA